MINTETDMAFTENQNKIIGLALHSSAFREFVQEEWEMVHKEWPENLPALDELQETFPDVPHEDIWWDLTKDGHQKIETNKQLEEDEVKALLEALYEYGRSQEPSITSKKKLEIIGKKLELDDDAINYITCDVGADYLD